MVLSVGILSVVLVNGNFVEGGEVALIDAQLSVEFVARLNEAVAEEGVDGLLRHAYRVGLEM